MNLCFLDGFDDGAIGNVMSNCHYYVFEEDIFDNVLATVCGKDFDGKARSGTYIQQF